MFAKSDSLVGKVLSRPRTKLSNWQTSFLDGVEIVILLSDFSQPLRCKNADAPHIYFTLHDAADLSPTLGLNQNAKIKKRRRWILFEM